MYACNMHTVSGYVHIFYYACQRMFVSVVCGPVSGGRRRVPVLDSVRPFHLCLHMVSDNHSSPNGLCLYTHVCYVCLCTCKTLDSLSLSFMYVCMSVKMYKYLYMSCCLCMYVLAGKEDLCARGSSSCGALRYPCPSSCTSLSVCRHRRKRQMFA